MDKKSWMPCTQKIWASTCNSIVDFSFRFYTTLSSFNSFFYYHLAAIIEKWVNLMELRFWVYFVTCSRILLLLFFQLILSILFSGCWYSAVCCCVWWRPVSSLWSFSVIHGASQRQNDSTIQQVRFKDIFLNFFSIIVWIQVCFMWKMSYINNALTFKKWYMISVQCVLVFLNFVGIYKV